MKGVAWHIGVRGANKGGILSDTPPPPLLDVWGNEGFFPAFSVSIGRFLVV